MKKDSLWIAYTLCVGNAVVIGFSFLFVKTALFVADAIDLLMYRFLFALLFLCIPIACKWVTLDYKEKSFKPVIVISFLYPIFTFGLQAYGLVYATSSEGGIIFALTPIMTVLMAVFFLKEKVSKFQSFFVFLSVLGVIYIFLMKEITETGFQIGSYLGILLLTLSVFAFAGYNTLSRSLSTSYTPVELSFGMMASGASFFTILSVSKHMINGTLQNIFLPLMDVGFLFSVLYLGVFCSLLTSVVTNFTLSKIEASKFSVFANLSTIIAIAAGVLFLDEKIDYYHVIGAFFVIVGVTGVNLKRFS